ncbi:hypothetical protein PV10_02820 [Exophiala mesophila]|uniref:Uncharacterized protein n=1 Tax=Exophiala mesophila TaxID=212818 RepID=A0A0D1X063_EXOME|nr:uncharacterized protein PV10_02820 [Exophiala mesophila]KIV95135.1 hypothetical protein PV10_02820 [Exophiala mesophila]
MAAEQRKLLEKLMGDQYHGPGGGSKTANLTLTSPGVCRSYLAGTCPHDLFTNTKQDLGPCPKAHPELLKIEYENLSAAEKQKHGFDYDYVRDMQKYIDDCNRRIDQAQRRLEKTPDEIRQTNELLRTISDLSKTINTGLLEVACLGESGSVSLATTEFYKVRTAKVAKEQAERDLKSLSDTSGPSGHQKLQVCDVCGAYLSRLDNDRRLADHFYGKMHLGYAQMRKTYEALQKELKGRPPPIRQGPEDGGSGTQRGEGGRYDDGGYGDGPGGGGGWGGRGGGGGGYGGRGYGRGGGSGGGGYRGGRGRGRW